MSRKRPGRLTSLQFPHTHLSRLVSVVCVSVKVLVFLFCISDLQLNLISFFFSELLSADPPPCATLLKMESAVGVLVSQFKAYAGSDGSSDTLSRDEFHRLVTSQLPNFVKVRMH